MTPKEKASEIINSIEQLLKDNVTAWNPLNQHAGFAEPLFNGSIKKLALMQVDAIMNELNRNWSDTSRLRSRASFYSSVKEEIILHFNKDKQ